MALRLGSSTPSKLYLGATEVTKAYLGASVAYETGGGAWTPAELGASLALWLDADDASTITLNGSNVSQWDDKSGNARNATQASAANQPTYSASGINGKPMVQGDNSNDVLIGSFVVPRISDFTTVLVGSELAPGDFLFDFYNVADSSVSRITNLNAVLARFNGSGNTTAFTTAQTLAVPFIATATHTNSAASLRFNQYIDGVQSTSFPIDAASAAFSSGDFDSYAILDDHTGGNAWNGGIGEYVVATGITDADRQKIEGYLAWKWGLETNLPVGHPYKNTPPTV